MHNTFKPAKKCIPKILGHMLLGALLVPVAFGLSEISEYLDSRKYASLSNDIG